MLRLTLRSRSDGRFLARVVESNGYPFVLDFGDRAMITDVSRRLQHGFSMWRYGELLEINPQQPEFMQLLADHYVSEGALVFFEEPGWSGREHELEDRVAEPTPEPVSEVSELAPSPELLAALDDSLEDESTELIELDDLPTVDEFMEPEIDPTDLPEPKLRGPDEVTEQSDLSSLRRKLANFYDPPIVTQSIDDDDDDDDFVVIIDD